MTEKILQRNKLAIPQVRVSKELRELSAMSVCAVALACVSQIWTKADGVSTAVSSNSFFALYWLLNYMGVSTFGAEFAHGTMGRLLAEPVSRTKIWREKMLLTAAAMAPCSLIIFVIRILAPRDRSLYFVGFIASFALCALVTGAAVSLVVRQRFTAFFIAALMPLFILLIFNSLLGFGETAMQCIMTIWSVVALYASWCLFKRLEV